ncbi:MAG: hypothetical protein NC231_07230 [Bacillus sp. (in: Bacteria)]|nr:hypothetical protein [Bacillus sp. (in: firmicutes)]MCM1426454.1 hypothetical protein [Eubacterium sp.]
MELKSIDELEEVKMLLRGLCDVMYDMEKTAAQDKMISVTVLCPFEAVIEKACLMIDNVVKTETKNF